MTKKLLLPLAFCLLLALVVIFGFVLLDRGGEGAREGRNVTQPAPGAAPPTIILIISDDQDYPDFGFAGNASAHTPNIDRLAREGAMFPLSHVSMSRCRPSLASLLSGLYPHQNGVYYNFGGPELSSKLGTLPLQLRRAGYLCWVGGKYWEGDPRRLGFSHGEHSENTLVRRDQRDVETFLDKAGDQPAFLWWAPMLPHVPHNPPQRLLDLIDPDMIQVPDYVPAQVAREWRVRQHTMLAMGAWLDEGIGSLFEILKKHNRLDNTLVVFLIDNGYSVGRPAKGTAYEHGFRTPVILWDPSKIKPEPQLPELISSLDLLPTMLEWAGAQMPVGLEGRSLWPIIRGEPTTWREDLIGAAYPRTASNHTRPDPSVDAYALYVRNDRWKYIVYLREIGMNDAEELGFDRSIGKMQELHAGQEDLFDLQSDPDELHSISDEPGQSERVAELRRKAFEWWTKTGGGKLGFAVDSNGNLIPVARAIAPVIADHPSATPASNEAMAD